MAEICPNCGKETFAPYSNRVRNGAIAAGIGAFLLGPVGLVAAAMAIPNSNTGRKCSSCGYVEKNENSETQNMLIDGLAQSLCNEGKRQFNEGYQEEKRRIEASEDY